LEQEEEFLTNKLQKQLQEILAEREWGSPSPNLSADNWGSDALKRAEDSEKREESMRSELKEYREKNKAYESQHVVGMWQGRP
jgi:hypothetical protein